MNNNSFHRCKAFHIIFQHSFARASDITNNSSLIIQQKNRQQHSISISYSGSSFIVTWLIQPHISPGGVTACNNLLICSKPGVNPNANVGEQNTQLYQLSQLLN
jgi:hypothetical protein